MECLRACVGCANPQAVLEASRLMDDEYGHAKDQEAQCWEDSVATQHQIDTLSAYLPRGMDPTDREIVLFNLGQNLEKYARFVTASSLLRDMLTQLIGDIMQADCTRLRHATGRACVRLDLIILALSEFPQEDDKLAG